MQLGYCSQFEVYNGDVSSLLFIRFLTENCFVSVCSANSFIAAIFPAIGRSSLALGGNFPREILRDLML